MVQNGAYFGTKNIPKICEKKRYQDTSHSSTQNKTRETITEFCPKMVHKRDKMSGTIFANFQNDAYLGTKGTEKDKIFICKHCDYTTYHSGKWKRHIETKKHKNNQMVHNGASVNQNTSKFWVCECGKTYKYHQGYYRHKNTCTVKQHVDTNSNMSEMKDLVVTMIEENRELRSILLDQRKQLAELQPQQNITNNNTINNTFNLNVFLNEDCKEAINMTEFVKSLEIHVGDLEHTRKNGLCAGVQSIFVNALKNMGTYKRPIHCTDVKRETLYIKDSDEWERVDDKKEQIRKPIASIAEKQRKSIHQWEDEHPNWNDSDKGNDEWNQLVQNVMDSVDQDTSCENRIIRTIAKEVKINCKE